MKIGGRSKTWTANAKTPKLRRGTSIENRLVRTSTLATLVVVTIRPAHVWPRRMSLPENRIAKMRGGASLDAELGDASAGPAPNETFAGTAGACAAQPDNASARKAAALQGS